MFKKIIIHTIANLIILFVEQLINEVMADIYQKFIALALLYLARTPIRRLYK